MIEHLGQQLSVLVDELRTVGDPEAVEAQLEAVSSEAAEQVASAHARATRAEQAQRRAEAEKAEADAAASEATVSLEQLTATLDQVRLDLAETTQARDQLSDELAALRAAMAPDQEAAREVQASCAATMRLPRASCWTPLSSATLPSVASMRCSALVTLPSHAPRLRSLRRRTSGRRWVSCTVWLRG
ncbi:hypothetical protein [Tessaracoccus lapidicaptus]|nr:hypothetical protein [Tessaracoccus lapidicaptus]